MIRTPQLRQDRQQENVEQFMAHAAAVPRVFEIRQTIGKTPDIEDDNLPRFSYGPDVTGCGRLLHGLSPILRTGFLHHQQYRREARTACLRLAALTNRQ